MEAEACDQVGLHRHGALAQPADPLLQLVIFFLLLQVPLVLGLQGPWQCQVCRDTDCLHHRSYGPISLFLSLL